MRRIGSNIRKKTSEERSHRLTKNIIQYSSDEKPLKTRERLLLPGQYTVEVRAKERSGGELVLPPKHMTIKAGELSLCRFGQ